MDYQQVERKKPSTDNYLDGRLFRFLSGGEYLKSDLAHGGKHLKTANSGKRFWRPFIGDASGARWLDFCEGNRKKSCFDCDLALLLSVTRKHLTHEKSLTFCPDHFRNCYFFL